MNIEDIKTKVKESFAGVESAEFLQKQIEKGVEKHRANFREYISLNPHSSFVEWKDKIEKSINQNANSNEELMAIGIFLLALEEFNHENI